MACLLFGYELDGVADIVVRLHDEHGRVRCNVVAVGSTARPVRGRHRSSRA